MTLTPLRTHLLLVLTLLIAGCSSSGGFFSSDDKSYRSQTKETQSLDIPPDLTSSGIEDVMVIPGAPSASLSDYQQQHQSTGTAAASDILPDFDGIKVKRDGDQRWLVIDATPQQVWPKVVEFWRKNGLLLVEQDPLTGIMTTDWLESRPNIEQGMITEFFRKALGSFYSSATRDQFRVRLEAGETQGTTELFLTHRGMVEELVENASGQADTTFWTPRPNEPETEAAMLRSLMVHLGVREEQAAEQLAEAKPKQQRSRLIKTEEKVELEIDEGFAKAWRLVGMALDRVGFAVEDRDRSKGIYYVRYHALADNSKKGFFSRLAFWRDDEEGGENQYQVQLEDEGGSSRAFVNNQAGERQNSKTATRLLTLLQEQIR